MAGDPSPLDLIGSVTVQAPRLIVSLRPDARRIGDAPRQPLILPFRLSTRTGRSEIVLGNATGPRCDRVLIREPKQAHARLRRDRAGGSALDTAPDLIRTRWTLRLAFLAPDLQRVLLNGRHPRRMTSARLMIDRDVTLLWSEQRRHFDPGSLRFQRTPCSSEGRTRYRSDLSQFAARGFTVSTQTAPKSHPSSTARDRAAPRRELASIEGETLRAENGSGAKGPVIPAACSASGRWETR
jgi:hypothetical protein